ncbi:iron complex outermembrane receptor protein [Rhizomicrobium palustre]|uniref:Iron complex outermembrane receptor protein n=1 Tax=Rhizomicrobium palustre TaxID=189966 RepID=A0A846MWR2_9PROT|nr:TonB-dependent receptor [Rhizomicrobium palustre]NIK87427.1 iron complex outermembrane receptor protein [Rhizomicrobium palustre]
MKLRAVFAGSASVLALASLVAPALAQEAMETVVVTGMRASLQRAMDIKRDTTAIVDAVSAEDIGKFPDKNVADALQRVPGVNTVSAASGEGGFDENDRVSIRGTSPSLTQTLVNGHAVSTGDWFILDQYQDIGRSVSYSLFPAEIVSSVKVYKSQQADLVEGGVAGAVDIITRKPLDFDKTFTVEVSAEAAYTTLRGDTTPQFNGLLAWKNDTNSFGVMLQGFYEQRNIRRDGQEFLGYAKFDPTDAAAVSHPDLAGVYYPTLIGSAYFEQERIRQGGSFAAQFRPSNALEITFDAFYSHMGASNKNNNYMFWGSKEFGGATANVPSSYKVVNNTLVSASLPQMAGISPIVADFIMRPHSMSDAYYFNGDVTYNPTDDLTIKVKAGYTRGAGTTPEQAAWEGMTAPAPASYDFSSGVAAVSVTGLDLSKPGTLTNDWAWGAVSKAYDREYYFEFDAEQKLDAGPIQSVKAGFRYADHHHKSDIWDGGVSYGPGPGYTGDAVSTSNYPSDFADAFKIAGMLTNVPQGDVAKIVDVLSTQKSWRSYTQSAADINGRASRYMWSGATDVGEQDVAGYVMANLGGDRWKGNIGVRIVNTQETIYQPVNGTAAVGSTCPVTGDIYSDFGCYHLNKIDKEYWDVLPSANISINVTEDQVLRFAAAETMARPDYSALGGAVNLTDLTHVGSGGNPNLKPVKSANYDVSWEWYYGPQSMISVSVFYMDLSSYVTKGITKGTYLDMLKTGQGAPVYSVYDITAPFNTSGHDEGYEIAWTQPIWGGFGIIANYAYTSGAETGGGSLVGNTKNTVNASAYFENEWLSARLAYGYVSSSLVGMDRSAAEYQNAYGKLDASVNVTVTDNLTLTFNGLNLTNQTLKYYANNATMPRALYSNGSQLYAGVRFKY